MFADKLKHTTKTMEVESTNNMAKWNGRVPPLDLSGVSVCPRETERRWSRMQQQNHISPKDYDHHGHQHHKIGADGLPIGKTKDKTLVRLIHIPYRQTRVYIFFSF